MTLTSLITSYNGKAYFAEIWVLNCVTPYTYGEGNWRLKWKDVLVLLIVCHNILIETIVAKDGYKSARMFLLSKGIIADWLGSKVTIC